MGLLGGQKNFEAAIIYLTQFLFIFFSFFPRMTLNDDFSLRLDGQRVGLVYFRVTFLVQKFSATWETRRMIERSTAIVSWIPNFWWVSKVVKIMHLIFRKNRDLWLSFDQAIKYATILAYILLNWPKDQKLWPSHFLAKNAVLWPYRYCLFVPISILWP